MSSMKAFFIISFLLISALLISSRVFCETRRLSTHLSSKHFSHADECNALFQFKNSLTVNSRISNSICDDFFPDIPSSLRTASWKEDSDCCTGWDGITCDNVTSNVISVDLTCSYLEGNFHSDISLFTLRHLSELSLGGNNLTGPIPSSICRMSSLEKLDLTYNHMNGTILPCFGNMSNLWYLSLRGNQFHGQLPSHYFQHSKLSVVALSYNMFDGFLPVPPRNALIYDVSYNIFIGEISSAFCNITTLIDIDLSNNVLSGEIPRCLVTCPKLEYLILSDNNLHGQIPEIPARNNNCSLKSVFLRNNHLRGKLPPSWALCKQLKALDLSSNELEGSFPTWLGALQNLSVLVLRSNRFYGPITPDAMTSYRPFPMLQIFDISNNSFAGTLPTQYIANFNSMMGGNRGGVLEYPVNCWIYKESASVIYKGVKMELEKIREALVIIDLSCNHFQDQIPDIVGNLNLLKGLNLSFNNLRGVIPSSLGNLTNLEWLDLSSNNLTGEIPEGLTSLTSLAIFNVSMNLLTGMVPKGKQFNTFQNDSFRENPGLCGLPLSKPCDKEHPVEIASAPKNEADEDRWVSGWSTVLMGYVIGTVIGISIGYIFIEIRKPPMWLIEIVERWRTRK